MANSRLTASGNIPELSMSEGDILNSNSGRGNGKVAPRSMDRAPPLPLRMVPSSSQSPYRSVVKEPSSLVLDAVDYSTKLPRRKKQRCTGCWNLSAFAWLFLVLAFLQGICKLEFINHKLCLQLVHRRVAPSPPM